MREFFDEKTGLTWVVPEVDHKEFLNPIFVDQDQRTLNDFARELNEYKSDNIDTYVTGGEVALGNFMLWAISGNELPYYAFDDGKLVATAIIDGQTEIYSKGCLADYIKYCSIHPEKYSNGMKGFVPLDRAKKLYEQSKKNNNIGLGFLVVIPTVQGRGIGTRAVSSIMHNPKFFAKGFQPITIDTMVHKNNVASQKVFQHNGFKDYSLELEQGFSTFHKYIQEM